MFQLLNGKEIPIKDTATFISKLNQQKPHHIGFYGTDPAEIENAMKVDVSEETAAIENGKLVGWIGADTDEDTAEIWGPFINSGYDSEIAFDLWKKLLDEIPKTVNNFILFFNNKNKLVKGFAEKMQFEQKTDQTVLQFSEEQLKELSKPDLEVLTKADHPTFIQLHDEAFPGTYYSGEEIIERLNQKRKVFVLRDGDHLAGYAYVEADPEFDGGYIEFIAVDPIFRGKGYGKKLLEGAVHWLFTFDSIQEIKLTVAMDNKNALGLYLSVGFEVEHEMHYFVKRS